MAFSIKMAKCKTCGKNHIVPSGNLVGMGYDDCPKCRVLIENSPDRRHEKERRMTEQTCMIRCIEISPGGPIVQGELVRQIVCIDDDGAVIRVYGQTLTGKLIPNYRRSKFRNHHDEIAAAVAEREVP